MKNKFAERFYELRIDKNMSRAEIGTILNVSTRLISYWENGERQCDFDMLIKIANCFSVSIDYLLGKTDYWYLLYKKTNEKIVSLFYMRYLN